MRLRKSSITDQSCVKIDWANFMGDFFRATWKWLERIWVVSHLPKVSITDQPRMKIAWANFMRDFFTPLEKRFIEFDWYPLTKNFNYKSTPHENRLSEFHVGLFSAPPENLAMLISRIKIMRLPKHFNYRSTLHENRLSPTYQNISITDQPRIKIAWTNFVRDFFHPTGKLLDRIWVVSHLPKHFNYRSTPHEYRLSEFHAGFFSNHLKNAWANLCGIPRTRDRGWSQLPFQICNHFQIVCFEKLWEEGQNYFRQADRETLAINPFSLRWSSLFVVSFKELHRRYSMRTIFRETRKIPINGIRNAYLR